MPSRLMRVHLLASGPRLFDRAQNAVMRPAAAQIVVKRVGDVRPRRRRIAIEQRLGRYQNAAETITALAGLLLEKGLLQRMRVLRGAKSFDCGDSAPGHTRDR